MNSLAKPVKSLRALLTSPAFQRSVLSNRTARVSLGSLLHGSSLGCQNLALLRGRSILLVTKDQLAAALALIQLDGLADRIVICPPDLRPEHFPSLLRNGEIDTIVSDDEFREVASLGHHERITCATTVHSTQALQGDERPTEWVLLTSGTTGVPKMIAHNLETLTGAVAQTATMAAGVVWGTFYDIRRYGGLQIFLRAVTGGASLILSDTGETIGEHLLRLAEHGVTHLSGTPSHWRRVLMSREARCIAPRYIRLSGEIIDQALLDNLKSFFPEAQVAHAFASTEAGVAFEVNDGRAGFPAAFLDSQNNVELKVFDGSLRIRSNRIGLRAVADGPNMLADPDGFVDTGDIVERRGDRYFFLGRRNGVINVGGLKVYPEEVEAVINHHPDVRMSKVHPRRNPITGSLVCAEVVLKPEQPPENRSPTLTDEILDLCRRNLEYHKIPVKIEYVSSLDIAAAGKLARAHA